MIKNIETIYKGYRFRSRLEARWAVFLDELNWQWEYEKEGFVLEDKSCYLPDFYLPELKTWLEVKPDNIQDEDYKKCILFSKGIGDGFNVILVNGLPLPRQYLLFHNGVELCGATLSTYIKSKGWCIPYLGGDWWQDDTKAFEKAKMARFEFEDKN